MDTDSMMLKMVPMRPTTWFVLMRQYTHGLVLSLSLAFSLSLSLSHPGRFRPTAWNPTYRGHTHSVVVQAHIVGYSLPDAESDGGGGEGKARRAHGDGEKGRPSSQVGVGSHGCERRTGFLNRKQKKIIERKRKRMFLHADDGREPGRVKRRTRAHGSGYRFLLIRRARSMISCCRLTYDPSYDAGV